MEPEDLDKYFKERRKCWDQVRKLEDKSSSVLWICILAIIVLVSLLFRFGMIA